MSETKHTPGPWRLRSVGLLPDETLPDETLEVSNGALYVDAGSIPVACIAGARVADIPNVQKERVANARLIAAAPELLETVVAYRLHHKLMMQVADDVDCPCKICQMAEAVEHKARA